MQRSVEQDTFVLDALPGSSRSSRTTSSDIRRIAAVVLMPPTLVASIYA